METFAAQFPRDFCALTYRCCAPEDVSRLFPYGKPDRDVNDCNSHLQQEYTRDVEVLKMGLAPVHYDGQRASRCLARVATMTCADLVKLRTQTLEPEFECRDVFTVQGSQPLGARCGQPYDCAVGLSCDQPAHDAPGVCRRSSELPASCPSRCPSGMVCNSDTNAMCVAGTPNGGTCQYDFRCANAVCWGADVRLGQDGVCGVPAGVCALQ
jgi:hypothetical protein